MALKLRSNLPSVDDRQPSNMLVAYQLAFFLKSSEANKTSLRLKFYGVCVCSRDLSDPYFVYPFFRSLPN